MNVFEEKRTRKELERAYLRLIIVAANQDIALNKIRAILGEDPQLMTLEGADQILTRALHDLQEMDGKP